MTYGRKTGQKLCTSLKTAALGRITHANTPGTFGHGTWIDKECIIGECKVRCGHVCGSYRTLFVHRLGPLHTQTRHDTTALSTKRSIFRRA